MTKTAKRNCSIIGLAAIAAIIVCVGQFAPKSGSQWANLRTVLQLGTIYALVAVSMDELNGYLRVATTNNTYTYSIYADDKQGFENYKDGSQKTANALYVLDSGLNIVGRAENVAPGESIYSVRFDGVAAYICTFRQIDPLFAYDLSNPTRPVKLGELKLPGFSEYLHVWSAGRLFGLGQSATEEGSVTGMDNKNNNENIRELGSAAAGEIHCLTIIGQIEGHQVLPEEQKTTKYEHARAAYFAAVFGAGIHQPQGDGKQDPQHVRCGIHYAHRGLGRRKY